MNICGCVSFFFLECLKIEVNLFGMIKERKNTWTFFAKAWRIVGLLID